jgi:RNA polymerase sigma factor (sigma-70 family)
MDKLSLEEINTYLNELEQYRDGVFKLACSLVGYQSQEDADDITQNVFLAAIQYVRSRKEKFANPQAWLYGTTKVCYKNAMCKRKNHTSLDTVEEGGQEQETGPIQRVLLSSHDWNIWEDLRDALEDIDKLDGHKKDVLRLIVQGYTPKEIADLLHMSDGSIRSHLSHGRNDLLQMRLVADRQNHGRKKHER